MKLSRLQVEKVRNQGITDALASGRRTQAVAGTFQYKSLCLFCTEPAASGDAKTVRKVSTLSFDQKLREVIERRNDRWALEVHGRLEGVHDLHAADAVYYKVCHARFVKALPLLKEEGKRGRPVQFDRMKAFSKLRFVHMGSHSVISHPHVCPKSNEPCLDIHTCTSAHYWCALHFL
jgi:hypothetical protein